MVDVPRSDGTVQRFLTALGAQVSCVPSESLLSTLLCAYPGALPDDDAALLLIASLTVAYVRAVRSVVDGAVDLDVREEAILNAALAALAERTCGS